MPTPQELATQFLIHFNDRDLDALMSLLAEDVRYNGRSGDGQGVHLLQEWVERASTVMQPQRWFGTDDLAVAEVDVTWHNASTQDVTDRATWAISFATDGDKISSISRYADVGEAVTKMGLVDPDPIPEAGFPMPAEK